MSGRFALAYSSSPPSTPGSERCPQSGYLYGDNPSTTPAGPPLSSAKTFTPAGIPHSTVFGSSQAGTASSLFSAKAREQQPPQSSALTNGGTNGSLFPPTTSYTTKIPLNDITQSSQNNELLPSRTDQEAGYDVEGEDYEDMVAGDGMAVGANDKHNAFGTGQSTFGSPAFD